jgi:hypothetical protein
MSHTASKPYNVKISRKNDSDVAFKIIAQLHAICVESNILAITPEDERSPSVLEGVYL